MSKAISASWASGSAAKRSGRSSSRTRAPAAARRLGRARDGAPARRRPRGPTTACGRARTRRRAARLPASGHPSASTAPSRARSSASRANQPSVSRFAAQRHDAGEVDEAPGRLQPERAAERRGPDHRPGRLGADRDRDHRVGDGGRRPARRPARGARRVGRVAGRAGGEVGELGRDRLAEDHRARRAQARHARGVGARAPPGVDRAAALGRQVRGVDDVLDADRDAVQRPARGLRVALARLGERGAGVEVRPRPDGLLALGDPLEARGDERRRGQIPGGDPPRRLGRAEAAGVRGPALTP